MIGGAGGYRIQVKLKEPSGFLLEIFPSRIPETGSGKATCEALVKKVLSAILAHVEIMIWPREFCWLLK